MIDLYTWSTPNGRKVSIMLEETGLPYGVFPIDISKGDQFTSDFVRINPNSKIPAIVDREGPGGKPFAVFESGAILIYLGDKTGKFLPKEPEAHYETLQWLMFQMGGVGPMFGQAHHFRRFAPEKIPYAIERYTKEARRLYGVMDARLKDREFLAGPYTIADMATFPWAARHEWQGVDLADFPNVRRWFNAINARPAVKKGMSVP
ncbi:MAG: glutathione S-transferase N-terminal domain-containing protein [Alphaproteobacteria bacterium]|nr:glutathione S-transferase N-terminal domain-containing protein [Alphaproteobacteria bacterium]